MEMLINAFAIIGTVVTASTLIVAGLEKLAAITPTTKDDLAVAKAKRVLSQVSAILDQVSVYTTKDKK